MRFFFFLILLFCTVFIRNTFLSSSLMPFEGWDEYQHMAVATFYDENGRMPILEHDLFPVSMSDFLTRHPHPSPSAQQCFGLSVQNYQGLIWKNNTTWIPAEKQLDNNDNTMLYPRLYQAQHGPIFYQVMAHIKQLFNIKSYESWADAGRIFNSTCGALMAVTWFALFHFILRNTQFQYLAYLSILVVASNSLFAFNHARVANDALANMLATGALYFYFRFVKTTVTKPVSLQLFLGLILGGICGIAVISKATVLPLLPVLILGVIISGVQSSRLRVAVLITGFILVGYLLTAGSYHLNCMKQYGQITAMQEAVKNKSDGKTIVDLINIIPAVSLKQYAVVFNHLHTGGWSFGRPPASLKLLWKTTLALSGLLVLIMVCSMITKRKLMTFFPCRDQLQDQTKKHKYLPDFLKSIIKGVQSVQHFLRVHSGNGLKKIQENGWELFLLCILTWCGLLYHSFHSMLARGYVATTPWYAIIILPTVILILLMAFAEWSKKLATGAALLLTVVFSTTYYIGTFQNLLFTMTNEKDFRTAITIVNGHHGFLRLPSSTLYVEWGLFILLIYVTVKQVFAQTDKV